MSRVVYFNGQFVPEAEARVSIYDSALAVGDMAFEVTRTCRGEPYRLRDHLERLFNTLEILKIDPGLSPNEFQRLTLETLRKNQDQAPADEDWNIIHNVSRGPAPGFFEAFSADQRRPTVLISCFPLRRKMAALVTAYDHGVDLVIPRQRSLPSELLDNRAKTRSRVHYQLAHLQAQETRPGSVALLVEPAGWLTETTSGNIFVVANGRLLTPYARSLLPGITRGVVLELAARSGIPVAEANITPAEAAVADEMFTTSTSIGILHARSLDGVTIADEKIGPITCRLRDELTRDTGLDFAEQARAYAKSLARESPSDHDAQRPR